MCSEPEDRVALPSDLYTAEQVRALDDAAMGAGIPGIELMERAGQSAFQQLQQTWPQARRVAIFTGYGNNAGDGYVIGRLAHEAGLQVNVYQVGSADRVRGDAATALAAMNAVALDAEPFNAHIELKHDVLVDALLGTGLDRPVEGVFDDAVKAINSAELPVMAVDIPSGLHADRGVALGAAVRADSTVTFIGLKQGMLTADGPEYCGKIIYSSLDVPVAAFAQVRPAARRLDRDAICRSLRPRARNSHKGHFGHTLVVGGDAGYAGAARMAAAAAARVGSGLVSLCTRPEHASLASLLVPEIMSHGVGSAEEIKSLLHSATVVAIGPGLGLTEWALALFRLVVTSDLPLVVDADALTLLAANPCRRDNWILTPHPGEAARLLQTTADQIQRDRFTAVAAIQSRFGGVCILKGCGTLVKGNDDIVCVCSAGNPGMASGGMGDILTGVIAGLLAQRLSPNLAAEVGVAVHASAADNAAHAGERGMLASDVLAGLREMVNPGLPTVTH